MSEGTDTLWHSCASWIAVAGDVDVVTGLDHEQARQVANRLRAWARQFPEGERDEALALLVGSFGKSVVIDGMFLVDEDVARSLCDGHQTGMSATQRPLPPCFAVLLLGHAQRDEVLADLQEWYAEMVETVGVARAGMFVAGKLLSAITGQILTVIDQVAGVIGKVWRRQKG